jgi:hypothetical protein
MKRRYAILLTMTIAAAVLASAAESRWQYVISTPDNERVYIDTQSYEYPEYQGTTRGEYVNFWTKWAKPDKTIMLPHYQLYCTGKRMRILGWATYSTSGALTGSSSVPSTNWEDIIPDSVGDALLRLFSDTARPPPIHARS